MVVSSSVHLCGFTVTLNINDSGVKIQLKVELLNNEFWVLFVCVLRLRNLYGVLLSSLDKDRD
jgi:hypothetical protein